MAKRVSSAAKALRTNRKLLIYSNEATGSYLNNYCTKMWLFKSVLKPYLPERTRSVAWCRLKTGAGHRLTFWPPPGSRTERPVARSTSHISHEATGRCQSPEMKEKTLKIRKAPFKIQALERVHAVYYLCKSLNSYICNANKCNNNLSNWQRLQTAQVIVASSFYLTLIYAPISRL